MEIVIKTCRNEIFRVAATSTETFGDVLQHLREQNPSIGNDEYKLIFGGHQLNSYQTVGSVDITPDKFLILAPQNNANGPSPRPQTTRSNSDPETIPGNPLLASVPVRHLPPLVSETRSTPDPGPIVVSLENLDNIVSMGFRRDDAYAALYAAYNNVSRAVEYLTTSQIPEGAPRPSGPMPPPVVPVQQPTITPPTIPMAPPIPPPSFTSHIPSPVDPQANRQYNNYYSGPSLTNPQNIRETPIPRIVSPPTNDRDFMAILNRAPPPLRDEVLNCLRRLIRSYTNDALDLIVNLIALYDEPRAVSIRSDPVEFLTQLGIETRRRDDGNLEIVPPPLFTPPPFT